MGVVGGAPKVFALSSTSAKLWSWHACYCCVIGSSLVAAMDFFNKLVVLQVMEYNQVVSLLTSAVYNPASSSGAQPSPSSSSFVVHRQVYNHAFWLAQDHVMLLCKLKLPYLYIFFLQAFRSIAKCLAVTCSAAPSNQHQLVSQFVTDIQNTETTDSVKLLALLSIGEIGQQRWIKLSYLEYKVATWIMCPYVGLRKPTPYLHVKFYLTF